MMQPFLPFFHGDNNSVPWYHGNISRTDVNTLLTINSRTDGLFLVGDSLSFPGDFTLYLCHNFRIFDYRIYSYTNFLSLDSIRIYSTLEELIDYYRTHLPSDCILVTQLERYVVKAIDTSTIDWKQIKIKRLCYGRFGKVYLAKFEHRKVALIPIRTIVDAKKLIDKCTFHENLVNVFGLTCSDNDFYLISEYANFKCLHEMLKKKTQKRLTEDKLFSYMYDICNAMTYLENLCIKHKQLWTRNIFVAQWGVAKLANFGLSEEIPNPTKELLFRWMAPETIGIHFHSNKSDIWSFGMCVWEIYSCGALPYNDEINYEVIYNRLREGYRLPKPETCEDEIYDLVEWCWKWTSSKRPTFKVMKNILQDKKRERHTIRIPDTTDSE